MFLTVFALFGILLPCAFPEHIVTTSYGKLRGLTDKSNWRNPLYTYKRVPFAKPPVGNLRFALPEAPEPWNHTLDATTYSPACISKAGKPNTSEDCLYINIFTSQECLTKKCPVIVYLHGGAFNRDSAVMFPDAFIKERYAAEGVVFAIPAFRLGVFGQLYYGPSSVLSENLILFDALLALNFVHNEISNFGGDPKQVTLMGHSTGASMVNFFGFSKIVDPDMVLFQKMIGLSAQGMLGDYDWMVDGSFMLTRKLNCYHGKRIDRDTANHAEMVNCLRKLDARAISNMQSELTPLGFDFSSVLIGAPFMNFGESIKSLKKSAPPRKMVYGTTKIEFRNEEIDKLLAPGQFLDFNNTFEVNLHYDGLLEDHWKTWHNRDASAVFISAATYTQELVKAGGEVYLFETRQWPLSFHVSDMQYFIGIHRELEHFPDMDILDSFYSKMLVNFTKYDVPSPEWEKVDPEKMNFLNLQVSTKTGARPKMENNYHEEDIKIWMEDMAEYDRQISAEKLSKQDENDEVEDYEYFDTPDERKIVQRYGVSYIGPDLPGTSWVWITVIFMVFAFVFLYQQCKKDPSQEKIKLLP